MRRANIFFTFIFTSICLISNAQMVIRLDSIWKSARFQPKRIQAIKSMNNGEQYTTQENDLKINKYSFKTGQLVSVVCDFNQISDSTFKKIDDYVFSSDDSKLLISTNTEPIYRRSKKAIYYIYDLKKQSLNKLNTEKVSQADFSPDGKKIAYTRANNLYVYDIEHQKETTITTDGVFNSIINGYCDWVYEEEFKINKGFYWSPDSKNIAFFRFDESRVKEFSFTQWGTLYPTQYIYKYPKAGDDNSIVGLRVYNLESAQTQTVDVGTETDMYIPSMQWTQKSNELAFMQMNRMQNKMELFIWDINAKTSRSIYTETNTKYVEVPFYWYFLKNEKQFIISSEKDGYNDLYLYDYTNGKLIQQLTYGKFDISTVYGFDENRQYLYFQAAIDRPYNREICAVNVKSNKIERLSTNKNGTNNALFSNTYQYYVNTFQDVNTPSIYTINRNDGKEINTLENNEQLKEVFKRHNFVTTVFSTLTTEDGVELNYWMMKPANMDPFKQYPLLMYVYGGPGSQQALNAYFPRDYAWYQMLVQRGYIIACVDNRGTGGRGEAFKKCTYQQLGKLEAKDQIAAAKYFGNMVFVDKSRIGIWGWSFGGYLSALCLFRGNDVFKLAASVAPVTNWRYYNTIYTERYMGKPQDNPSGYDDNSPIHFVKDLKGQFLLVHGTADDNVHFQNTIDLITALEKNEKEFDLQVFPDKNHSIAGGNTRYTLYKKLTSFILENL